MNVNAALQVLGGAANMPTGMTGSQWIVAGFTGTIGSITGTYSGPIQSYDATVYSFTSGSGTFIVPTGAPMIVDYLVVGGGGAGGNWVGGGGGAGGLVYAKGVQLPAGSYSWAVGAGGAGVTSNNVNAGNGSNSSLSNATFGNVLAIGGGAGGTFNSALTAVTNAGSNGGSGGGGAQNGTTLDPGGTAAIGQGNSGGSCAIAGFSGGGGGGGAGTVGASTTASAGGAGGNGLVIPITGSNVYYAGGGGGFADSSATIGTGGLGGGGAGINAVGSNGISGLANTGGGGGGAGRNSTTFAGGSGGSGVIILRVYTNTGSRMLIGDGSGYSLALSSQSNAVTTDVMTVTDQGNVSIGLSNAVFNGCHDAKFDSLGNMYVTDYVNHRIRKITPAGVVTTFLGNGSNTTLGGTGTGASISFPFGLAIGVMSGIETLFATSINNTVVAAPLSTGVMTIIAGSNGVSASTDSPTGTTARFNNPFSLALDTTNSYVFVADITNNRIRRIAYTGTYAVTTLGASGFVDSATPLTLTGTSVRGLVYDGTTSNFYYTTNTSYGKIALTSGGTVATNTSNASGFTYASGITFNSNKTGVYFVDWGLHQVFSAGLGVAAAVAIAGTSGVAGSIDATGLNATLNGPRSLTIDPAGSNLYIGDYGDNKIRKVNIATSNVTTYAGTGVAGFADGSVPTSTVVNNTLLVNSNVGINCNAPAYALDVSGNAAASTSIIGGSGYLGNLGVNSATTFPILGFNASNQAGIYGRKGTNNNYSGLDFVSWINQVATTVMTVSPNAAAVGINQTAPRSGTALDVIGNVLVAPSNGWVNVGQIARFESVENYTNAGSDVFTHIGIGSLNSATANFGCTYRWMFGCSNSSGGLVFQIRNYYTSNNSYSGLSNQVAVSINPGATSWTNGSDGRYKDIISNIDNATASLQQLRTVYYSWKSDDDKRPHIGIIAQDVAKVYPDAVSGDETTSNMMGVRYTELIPPIIAAIKELSARLSNVEAKLAVAPTS